MTRILSILASMLSALTLLGRQSVAFNGVRFSPGLFLRGGRAIMTKEVFMAMKAEERKASQPAKAAMKTTPITVLSGFLGAGKTTFLNYLLNNQEGLKFGLVVNDMAAVNIDAKQVRSQSFSNADGIDTMELQNGCVCCSLAEDMIASISKLVQLADTKGTKYDHIIVECSGIAEPRRIREFFQQAEDYDLEMIKKVKLDTLITVVDAMTFFTRFGSRQTVAQNRELAYRESDVVDPNEDGNAQREITELLLEQVECADIIIINKCDLLVDPKDVQLVENVIRSMNPLAKVITAVRGAVEDPLALVGSAKGEGAASLAFMDEHRKAVETAEKSSAEGKAAAAAETAAATKAAATNHDHSHDHHDPATCTDPTHRHSHASHNHEHSHNAASTSVDACKDPTCTSSDHQHDHSHASDEACHDATCTDTSHSHEHSHHHEMTTAEKRFGITSFVYKRRLPFHPQRFSRFLEGIGRLSVRGIAGLNIDPTIDFEGKAAMGRDPAFASARLSLLRSKGFVWMGISRSAAYFMSHAGQFLDLMVLGRWWADIPKEEWPADITSDITLDFDGTHGDRRQELVFIGQFGKDGGKTQKTLEEALDMCLLNPKEMEEYEKLSKKGDQALLDYFIPEPK